MSSLRRLFLAGVVIIAVTASLFLIRAQSDSAPDFPRVQSVENAREIVIEVPKGATGSEIAVLLSSAGVVKSSSAFFRVAVSDARSAKIAPGQHRMTLQISAKQALEQLLDPNRIPNLVRIFEGGWKSEVIASLEKAGFTKKAIADAFRSLVLPTGFANSEGLLFPAQYSFSEDTTAAQALDQIIARFMSDSTATTLLNGSKEFSGKELLIIASIIQAEGDTEDFKQVSRVIRNRLKIGMPLQMDATINYIRQVRGEIFVSRSSTRLKSPYNTYQRYGLPPGPIGSPGVAAMKAAMNPAQGDWLYFITVAPGDTRFTSSFDEFNSWKLIYTKNRKAGAFN